jgi:hypothetical protein
MRFRTNRFKRAYPLGIGRRIMDTFKDADDRFDIRERKILTQRIGARIRTLPENQQEELLSLYKSRLSVGEDLELSDFIHDPRFKDIFDTRAKELLEEMDERMRRKGLSGLMRCVI